MTKFDRLSTSLRMHSYEHNCNMCYEISDSDLEVNAVPHIIKYMTDAMIRFIKEKTDALDQRKGSKE